MNMRSYTNWTGLITLTLLLGLVCSCATTPVVKPPEGPFFVTSEITYLLDAPDTAGMSWARFTGAIRWNWWRPGN